MKIICAVLLMLVAWQVSAKTNVSEIQQAILANNASWVAQQNWVTELSSEERAQLCGAFMDEKVDPSEVMSLPQIQGLPTVFDWRHNNGNFVSGVRNQGGCGSCWAFSTAAQMESWWRVYHNKPDTVIDLSEQFIMACGDAGTCGGGWVPLALTFAQENGVPVESCLPYAQDDEIPCSDACPNWMDTAMTIPGWQYITAEEPIVENIKQAVFRHPVSANFVVYDDFYAYGGGVYQHVWGDVSGGHAVLIVGWEDQNQCWIVKNSWGPSWGENGFFRIKWGDSSIGKNIPFIYDNTTTDAIVLSDTEYEFSTLVDTQVQDQLLVTNQSVALLSVSCVDTETPIVWHTDTAGAYSGKSWWCGSPQIGGYSDHWLQYLDTPAITLPANATLTFNLSYALENPAGNDPPFDSWDGCNVWISTDGGESFQVIAPESPAYNSASCWAFGDVEQGWGMGPNIGAWAGKSNGWLNARFDLQAYAGTDVIIRFALASDMAFSSVDDTDLFGMRLDNISIQADGVDVFSNDAESSDGFTTQGFGEQAALWLTVENAVFTVPALSQVSIPFTVDATGLYPGEYHSEFAIYSNDQNNPLIVVPLHLTVQAKTVDLRVDSYQLKSLYLLNDAITPCFTVVNWGSIDVDPVQVSCTISKDDSLVYSELASEIAIAGKPLTLKFPAFAAADTGRFVIDYKLSYTGIDGSVQQSFQATTLVSDLVEDFEAVNQMMWNYDEDSWIITAQYGGFNGNTSLKTGGAQIPHKPGLSGIAACMQKFTARNAKEAKLSYAAFIYSELDVDVCYTEISVDSVNWIEVDAMSGMLGKWQPRSVNLLDYLPRNSEAFWFRFRYVSDTDDEYIGVLLDDIHYYYQPGEFATTVAHAEMPDQFSLQQNYPNPFNPQTTIAFTLPQQSFVTLDILNLQGQLVQRLAATNFVAGHHQLVWDAAAFSAGIYFYRIRMQDLYGNSATQTKKMLLVK